MQSTIHIDCFHVCMQLFLPLYLGEGRYVLVHCTLALIASCYHFMKQLKKSFTLSFRIMNYPVFINLHLLSLFQLHAFYERLTICLQPQCLLVLCQIKHSLFLKMALETYEFSNNSNNTDQTLVRLETVFLEKSFVTFAVEVQPACFS